jgi:hypothetical protein
MRSPWSFLFTKEGGINYGLCTFDKVQINVVKQEDLRINQNDFDDFADSYAIGLRI